MAKILIRLDGEDNNAANHSAIFGGEFEEELRKRVQFVWKSKDGLNIHSSLRALGYFPEKESPEEA